MASLVSPLLVSPSTPSSSSSRCFIGHRRSFIPKGSRLRPFPASFVKCDLSESPNGKPSAPQINDASLHNFLASKRLESSGNRDKTRLKLFSGTANPSLSQAMNLIGDVKGKVAVMVDDMIDTAGEFEFSFARILLSTGQN